MPHRLGFLADSHNLPAVAGDRDQLLAHELAVLAGLDLVLAGLEADFLGPRPADDDVAAIHGDTDAGVIDLHHQRALRRKQADDSATHVGHAGRLAHAQAAEEQDQRRGNPEPPGPSGTSAMCRAREHVADQPRRQVCQQPDQLIRHLLRRGGPVGRLLGVQPLDQLGTAARGRRG